MQSLPLKTMRKTYVFNAVQKYVDEIENQSHENPQKKAQKIMDVHHFFQFISTLELHPFKHIKDNSFFLSFLGLYELTTNPTEYAAEGNVMFSACGNTLDSALRYY